MVNAYLDLVPGTDGAWVMRCRCGHTVGPASRNYKEMVLEARYPLARLGPQADPHNLSRGRLEVREYYCPGCLVLLEAEVARPEDPVLWDVQLKVD